MMLLKTKSHVIYSRTKIKTIYKENLNLRIEGPFGSLHYTLFDHSSYVIHKKKYLHFLTLKLWKLHSVKFLQKLFGVMRKWNHSLLLVGLGYRLYKLENALILKLGYSHLIYCKIPKKLSIVLHKNALKIESINYYLLKQFSSFIKALKSPDVYKGKGIYFLGEKRLHKQGKIWQR